MFFVCAESADFDSDEAPMLTSMTSMTSLGSDVSDEDDGEWTPAPAGFILSFYSTTTKTEV